MEKQTEPQEVKPNNVQRPAECSHTRGPPLSPCKDREVNLQHKGCRDPRQMLNGSYEQEKARSSPSIPEHGNTLGLPHLMHYSSVLENLHMHSIAKAHGLPLTMILLITLQLTVGFAYRINYI